MLEMEWCSPETSHELNSFGTRTQGDAFSRLPRFPALRRLVRLILRVYWNKKEHLVCRYAERGGFIKHYTCKRTCTYSPVSIRDTFPPWLPFSWCAREVRSCPARHSSVEVTLQSGKTSLIHSLAGELGLDIYVVSLSSKGCVVFGSSLIPR